MVSENALTLEEKVTLRRLLSHTAGLIVHGFDGYAAGAEIPTLLQILDGAPPANSDPIRVNLVPGSRWRYSGGGFVVLQQLLEDIANKLFTVLLKELVFKPLKMVQSTYLQPLPVDQADSAATGHDRGGKPVSGKWHTYPELAAAGLWSTPLDLARFLIEIQSSNAGKSNIILSTEMAQEMLTTQIGDETWGYGLGLQPTGSGKAAHFGTGGSNAGYRCRMFAFKETGHGAVVLTNGERGEDLYHEVLRSIAHVYKWSTFQPAEKIIAHINPLIYQDYTGEYTLADSPDHPLIIVSEKVTLYLHTPSDGCTYELYPETDTQYFRMGSLREYSFVRDASGKFHALEISGGGGPLLIAQKMKDSM